jgi:hypothetical protein
MAAFAVLAEFAALFAGLVMVVALPVVVFEIIGFAAGDSWNPITAFENAQPIMHPILGLAGCVTAMWVLAGLLQAVPFLVQEVRGVPERIRWLTAYRAALAAAQAQAGEFASAFNTALRAKGRRRAEALTEIATAQAEAGKIAASRATFTAAVEAASGIRGKERVETLTAIATAQARVGDRKGARATLAAARAGGRQLPGAILTLGSGHGPSSRVPAGDGAAVF